MALSVEKLLTDAHTLILHLKEHDSQADNIMASSQALFNKVEAMKQYQDDITELNEIAKHRPRSTLVLGIAQENRQIRELQQENRELQVTLEEHQSALELIMQKYREHTVKLLQSNRLERAIQEKEVLEKDSMCHLMDKIDEMAGVMQKAIEVDESVGCVDKQRLSRLEVENQSLREMLEICTTSKSKIIPLESKKEETGKEGKETNDNGDDEDDDDDDDTDTECEQTIIIPSMKKESEVIEEKEGAESKKKTGATGKSKESAVSTPSPTASPAAGRGGKAASPNKAVGDVKKTKLGLGTRDVGVKKTASNTTLKKETGTLKKAASTEAKKDPKGRPGTAKPSSTKK